MRVHVATQLRKARAKKRAGVALEDRAITFQTRSRYHTAVLRVLPILEQSPLEPDEAVCQWIEDQYEDGEGITYIGDALSGLHHFAPWLKGSLKASWRLFRLWRRLERPQQAAPLPEAFCAAMVGRFIELEDLDMAAACVVGFWGLLRTGEILSLFPYQILIGQNDAIIQLGMTKTGLRRQQDENVIIRHEPSIELLRTVLAIRTANHSLHIPLVAGGGPRFRHHFDKVLEFFNLGKRFRPYSLRRGGATADFRAHNSMERTLIKGRWGTNFAARQYIQEGLSVLTTITISPSQSAILKQYASYFAT
eukprot:Skav233564  [mRNA]  locus=scaffold563:694998:695918:- [translate_table: standard]